MACLLYTLPYSRNFRAFRGLVGYCKNKNSENLYLCTHVVSMLPRIYVLHVILSTPSPGCIQPSVLYGTLTFDKTGDVVRFS